MYNWKKVMSGNDVAKVLENNGWELLRQKGSHRQYRKNQIVCTIPMHSEIKAGTLSSIKRTIELAEKL
jgi:predicted RNA binding protein YcfA (HicA-like mRNA interferase family)